ncbi:MAG: DinB family protein [Dehalococcoidia bacterium]
MDSSVTPLIDELDANRAMFTALCRACTLEQLSRVPPTGRWSVADHVAHVASYDQLAILHLAGAAGAAPPDFPNPGLNGDAWNDAEVQRRSGRTVAALQAEMDALRAAGLALLTALRAEELESDVYFAGDARRSAGMVPLRLWLRQWSKHDMLHARVLLRAIPELALHPDFAAWLADDPLLDALERGERARGASGRRE